MMFLLNLHIFKAPDFYHSILLFSRKRKRLELKRIIYKGSLVSYHVTIVACSMFFSDIYFE